MKKTISKVKCGKCKHQNNCIVNPFKNGEFDCDSFKPIRKPTPKEIETFIQEFGFESYEIAEVEKIEYDSNSIDELAINLGYVWIELYEVWFNKNNSSYTKRHEEILNYLRNL